ncbi:ORF6N domain-containing protein [Brevibacillus laterosporus]|nr:ORF6N domain-containing protein [Brevibacillus laterosporus]TPG86856.1 ORF6N domain-containing protein [Brevibacillus laterosporus]
MNQLQVIEQQGKRVLTTNQLAEVYGADVKHIHDNFQKNEGRYKVGKHYFVLQGEELKQFKASTEFSGNLKFAPILYLWTEKGAWLHAKSLNTDEAWDAYEMLVDAYYQVKQTSLDVSQLPPELQMFNQLFNQVANQHLDIVQTKERVSAVEKHQAEIKEILSLNPTEWRKKVTNLLNRIAQAHGGFQAFRDIRNESYEKLEERAQCNLSIRLKNKQSRMAFEGLSKSKINSVNKLDVIADDARLTEIYLAIVKEMAIKYQVRIA